MSTDFEDWVDLAGEKIGIAEMAREKGDNLSRRANEDRAQLEFEIGLANLQGAIEALPKGHDLRQVHSWATSMSTRASERLIEVLGSRGGLLRRIGNISGALDSNELGAKVEQLSGSSVTYNRLNVIKNSIILGTMKIDDLRKTAKETADQLDKNLNADAMTNAALNDKGWPWADLGDCYLILGDLARAEIAYEEFFNRIEPSSRKKPIPVLQRMHEALAEKKDPSSAAAITAIETIIGRLEAGDF